LSLENPEGSDKNYILRVTTLAGDIELLTSSVPLARNTPLVALQRLELEKQSESVAIVQGDMMDPTIWQR
jgi:hypothetical protein